MKRLTFKERLQNGATIWLTIAILLSTAILLTKTESLFGAFGTYVVTMALIYSIGALSVNLISGYAGQLSLGQAGFFAIGAYSAGIFAKNAGSILPGAPMPVVIIIGIIIAAVSAGIFGFLVGIPTLRLSGDYLAIVTLGFAEIIRVFANNLDKITGGATGLVGIPKFSTSRTDGTFVTFIWVFVVFSLIVVAVMLFSKSASGRRVVSVREDEIASNAMGIDVRKNKQIAFVMSSVIAGVGGALFAFNQGSLYPINFTFQMSVDFLIIAVFGGLGSFTGTILAGLALTVLNQGVLPSFPELEKWRLVIYAIMLILIMVYRPQGLLGTKEWSLSRFWNDVFKIEEDKESNKSDSAQEVA